MRNETVIIAIDPGATGAIVSKNPNFPERCPNVTIAKMPETERELWDKISEVAEYAEDHGLEIIAFLEKVGFHRKGNSASASVKFATNVGLCRMALTAAKIPYVSEPPQKWMKALPITLPDDKDLNLRKKKRKKTIREYVQRRYPHAIGITDTTADAVGMLSYMEDVYLAGR